MPQKASDARLIPILFTGVSSFRTSRIVSATWDYLPIDRVLQLRVNRKEKGCYAMWLTARNVAPTIAPKPRINQPAKGNGTCADSNRLAKPNDFSHSTVSSRIFSE